MAKYKKPIEVVIANGKKHLTKAEIEERRASEVKPITDGIAPPEYLTKKQKEDFLEIADQLKKLKIMGETDIDALARYVVSREFYIKSIKKLRSSAVQSDSYEFMSWTKVQKQYFEQCRACANDLGLTISSRCRLVVPQVEEPTKKTNKFNRFEKSSDGS